MWSWRLAPALAACALGVDAAAQQDFDIRPIYYAMLEAVESSFTAHSENIEEAYRTGREALGERVSRDLQRLQAEGDEIERARQDGDAAFEAERAALNARIEVLNQAVERLESDFEGTTATIESYREAYEHVLAELRTARLLHRELNAAIRTRGESLDDAARAYRDGTSEDGQEIVRLDNAYRRFAAQVLDAFGKREAALGRERDSLRAWLHEQSERFERAEGDIAPLAEQYAALEDDHDRVQGELNRRIEAYNERVRTARDDDTDLDELAGLRDEIAEHRRLLEEHRGRATTLALEIASRRATLLTEFEAFKPARSERKEVLRLRTEALASEQRDIVALVVSRRIDVQAQIEAVEDRIRAHLAALRADVDAAQRRLREEFGSAPADLFAAAAEWTQSLDPSHLYDSNGAPRLDRSPSRSAAIYEAVNAVRELESEARGALGEHLAELQRQRAEIARARQDLIERQNVFAMKHTERRTRWAARLEAANEESRRLRDALSGYLEGKLALVGFELQAMQGAVLDVLGTPTTPRPEPAERERLLESVSEQGAELGRLVQTVSALSDSPVEGFVATGASRGSEAPDVEWQQLSAEYFPKNGAPEEHTLDGESKRRVLAAWYERLHSAGTLHPLARRLSEHFPSRSAGYLENTLYGLFEKGMCDAGDVVRFRWMDEKSAYQIRILDRSYWLQPDGSLLLTPLTW